MDTRKKTLEQFQQETNENFEKFTAMFDKLMTEVQSLKEKAPTSSSGSGKGPMVVTGGEGKPYLKLHFPRFSGDDPTGWIYQSEQYFDFQKVAVEDQVNLASFHLDGIALQWHRWYAKTKGPVTWSEFTTALLNRFGPTDYEDPSEALHRLKQLTSVGAYVEAFERLSHRVDGLPEAFLVGCFIGGLKEEIRLEVKLKKPRHLVEAIGIARLVEEKFNLQGSQNSNPSPKPTSSQGLLGPGPTQQLALPAPNPVRRLTSAEARDRREKGLCYYCDEQYTPGHKCGKPQLFMISDVRDVGDVVHVEDPPKMTEDIIQAEISFLALSGTVLPQTLRLAGKIKTKDIVVLVDGGSTHNFISQALVAQLGLTVDDNVKFEVVVANSDTLVCVGRVRNLTIMFSGYTVTTDFLVLPVAACPLVLGIHWLKTLGPVEIDFENLTIGFHLAGSSHKLYGLKRAGLNELQHNRVTGVRAKKPYPVFRLEDKASVRGVDCYVPGPFRKKSNDDIHESKKLIEPKKPIG
ncbi:putative retrotransposon gag domain, aspartic peptidase domain superfamily [Helianthus annuus]|nr:putative retrotransposon gag domain, aspartic peptidase domain superfamily [Helianthus annuus]